MSDTAGAGEDVPELEGPQKEIRDQILSHNSGLFCMNCNPGAGKSTLAAQVAAHILGRAATNGFSVPAEHCCFVSFSRDDAASLAPDICTALPAIADRDPAIELDDEEIAELKRQVQQASNIGTVDSVLRGVFKSCHTEFGFDSMPTVGNALSLNRIRETVIETVRERHPDTYERLVDHYGVQAAQNEENAREAFDDMLNRAHTAMRNRGQSIQEFESALLAVHDDVYPSGKPETFDDVGAAIRDFIGENTAAETKAAFDAEKRDEFLTADQACWKHWKQSIREFVELLRTFKMVYDIETQEQSVLSHTDVAHWVRRFFEGEQFDTPFRRRLRRRYHEMFQAVIVDEAQDLSAVQHDALAALVPDTARVLCVADPKQTVYDWRTARPALFQNAVEDGQYFGIDWETHYSESMDTTYRLRPDIARTVNTVFRPVFADEARGGGGRLDIDFEPLESAREPRPEPSVHIARYHSRYEPGDDGIERRAASVSTYLAAALADGTLGDDPSVTVLFRHRYPMATYADALEGKGLSVGYGGKELFASPLVQFASAVVQWLQDPYSRDETAHLVDNELVPRLDHSREPDRIIDALCVGVSEGDADLPDDAVALTDGETRLLEGLTELADRQSLHLASSAGDIVEDVVDTLALPAAPIETDTSPAQRVANMDALVETISNFENDDRITLAELPAVMAELCDDEAKGPSQPMVDEESFDVVLKTVHRMKGDQDDVVVVAELGNRVGRRGPWEMPFLDRGDTVALSAPRNHEAPPIPGLDQGVFSRDYSDMQLPTGEYRTRRDAGLRWAHDRTRDSSRELAGSPTLASVAADHRAEEWRTLFVAMTRAMEHLVVPLPESSTARPQDSWLATLHEALEFDGAHTDSRHQITVSNTDGPDTTLTFGVNEPDIISTPQTTSTVGHPHAATLPDDWKTGWTPKHVNGSSLFPLVSSPEANFVPHIQSTALGDGHRDTVPDTDAPLDVVNPDILGKIAHDAIGAVVTGAVNATDVRPMSTAARRTFERLVDKRAGHLSDSGRERVLEYLHEEVCSQFLVTDTYERLRECQHVYREEPIHAVLEAGTRGRAVESQNQADFISQDSEGTWYIDEIKLTFSSLDEQTRRRHQLQTSFYEWLLETEVESTEIHSKITYLGAEESVEDAESPIVSIKMWGNRLDNLI